MCTICVTGVDATRLLSRAPGLLTVVDAWLEERLQAFRDIFPDTRELVAVISACPQAIARRDVSQSSQRLIALKDRLPHANLTTMIERCPPLVTRWLEQGCLVERIDRWAEAFPDLAIEDMVIKIPQLLGLDVEVGDLTHLRSGEFAYRLRSVSLWHGICLDGCIGGQREVSGVGGDH